MAEFRYLQPTSAYGGFGDEIGRVQACHRRLYVGGQRDPLRQIVKSLLEERGVGGDACGTEKGQGREGEDGRKLHNGRLRQGDAALSRGRYAGWNEGDCLGG